MTGAPTTRAPTEGPGGGGSATEAAEPGASLVWLSRALFSDDAPLRFIAAEGRPRSSTHHWMVRPDADSAELLVPTGSDRAAAAVVRRYQDGLSSRDRLRMAVAEVAVRTGAIRRLWPHRVGLVGESAAWNDPDRSVVARACSRLRLHDGPVAITLGPPKENRKPVVQLFDGSGRTVAFVKVAVDPTTSELIANETHWLQRVAGGEGALRAPRVLDTFTWRDRPVLVMAPLDLPRRSTRRGPAGQRLAARIASYGDRSTLPAERTAPVVAADRDLETWPDPDMEALVRAVVRSTAGDVSVGAWHGDLVPWNMASRPGHALVWDWEYAGDHMPIGADQLHHEVFTRSHLHDEDPGRVLADTYGDLDEEARPAARLWMLELARRERRQRLLGAPPAPLGVPAAAHRFLASLVDGPTP